MIHFRTGDILAADVEALVNTVNCVGVMGRGIALQFKKRFPENFRAYAKACEQGEMRPGRMFVFETRRLTNPRFIINFPTKRHWRGNSRLDDIEAGLSDLTRRIRERGVRSVAIPPLGSGLGGLDWTAVRRRIEEALAGIEDVHVVVFEPSAVPTSDRMVRNRRLPEMTAGRAALVGLIDRYRKGLLDPFVTLLEVHKLMYFMQAAGEPLKLRYAKGPYGPYAENLRHVLHAVEGHFISGYADGGDAPDKPLELVPGAVEDATSALERFAETGNRLGRVGHLVEGFESPFGLELLSTVHWILDRDSPGVRTGLVARTHAWNDRKKLFSPRQIELAADVLTGKGWVGGAVADTQH